MRGHFLYLRFKTFPMTPRTPQCKVFWALLSNSKHSGAPEDSKSPTLEVLGFTPTLGQSGVATMGVPTMGILGLPLGSPGTKCHLDAARVERRIKYYKGEGGGFPQVRAMVNLVSLRLPVTRPSTKSAQTMH